jgi:hypothetical protein
VAKADLYFILHHIDNQSMKTLNAIFMPITLGVPPRVVGGGFFPMVLDSL